jgi:uncharacterized surface protein with fasciclin (FAS1) repeats
MNLVKKLSLITVLLLLWYHVMEKEKEVELSLQQTQLSCYEHNSNSCSNNNCRCSIRKSRFSTLVAAVKAAGLVETLSRDGPFTVFAN